MNYVNPKEMYDEIAAFRQKMSECALSATAQPSDQLGLMMIQMADGLLMTNNFKHYDEQTKQDLKSHALYKMTRGLMTIRLEYADNDPSCKFVFNYFTRTAYLAFLTELQKRNKHINLVRDITAQQLKAKGLNDSDIAKMTGADHIGTCNKKKYKFNKNIKNRFEK